jgi:hypothetical protein
MPPCIIILNCFAFAPFLLPAAIDVGALTATSCEVMRVLVITTSLARLGGSGHVVWGKFQWSKVWDTRGFRVNSMSVPHYNPIGIGVLWCKLPCTVHLLEDRSQLAEHGACRRPCDSEK